MPAALTDIKGGSVKLESSLTCPEKAWSPNATLMMTWYSGVASMTPGNPGVSSMVAEDLGMSFMTGGGSGMAAQTGEVAALLVVFLFTSCPVDFCTHVGICFTVIGLLAKRVFSAL
ncbi:olfactomedin 2A [Labeo rohita]|uniref:Olfactomedin 2A n=1 Tax=Labeo rohita TaxID=84645 RepID=A0A498ME14_LABRO|nr:olfactomedin 2A [Labeo rohita]